MSIWQFEFALVRRLLALNVVNALTGIPLLGRDGFWRGVGSQSLGWGLLNIGIALAGESMTRRRRAALPDPDAAAVTAAEARNIRKILWINAALDVCYMAGGQLLAETRGRGDSRPGSLWRGVGQGIVLQGGLLFLFDLVHALIVPGA